AILYEMLSRNPFRRKSAPETLAAILHESPPPLQTQAELPVALEALIFRCLEKDPGERFQTARDVAFIMESLMGELRRPAAPRLDSRSRRPASSIAVLPFADMSPARDQDYLCEGIAEELINVLARIEGLRVAARSSSFQFRGAALDIRAVGARLGVAAVLEGGVRKAGDRLRVTVQLVDVADGYQRWSQRYDGKLDEVFAIQDEIAASVATALRGALSQREKEVLRRPETNMETYEYFLRGRQLMHRFSRASLESAKRMFERAIELEPKYALAYAGLAASHSWFYEWWGGGQADLEAADRASRRALELAPDLAEAHASRGFVLSLLRQYDGAAERFEAAIRLNPNSYDAHYYYARTCFASGRIERSAELFRKSGAVRQEDYQSMILLHQSLGLLGRDEEAREALREGIFRAERQLELDPNDARALSLGANALFNAGQKEKAMRWSERALALHPDDQGVLTNGACLRARAGLKEEALDLLERTFAKGWGKRDWIEHDPDYDSLRDDPRFQALLDKLQ
ncbi:MAG: tetratricopeptide repeat protein, partial [Acidobacteriota bacterium]